MKSLSFIESLDIAQNNILCGAAGRWLGVSNIVVLKEICQNCSEESNKISGNSSQPFSLSQTFLRDLVPRHEKSLNPSVDNVFGFLIFAHICCLKIANCYVLWCFGYQYL